MSRLQSYRFATPSQWNTCLFSQAQRDPRDPESAVRPFPPFTQSGEPIPSLGAHAPVVTETGVLLWLDDAGKLQRLEPCCDRPESIPAPCGLVKSPRIVASAGYLWALGPKGVGRYEADSFTLSLTVEIAEAVPVDIANGAQGSVIVLTHKDGHTHGVTVTKSGYQKASVELTGLAQPRAFAYLKRTQRYVVLTEEKHPRLLWFAATGGRPLVQLTVAALLPCFEAAHLAADGPGDRLLLAGDVDGQHKLLTLDADGNVLGDLSLTEASTGLAAARDSLIVTSAKGVLRFSPATKVPDDGREIHCALLTPLLQSDGADPWQRIDATAQLPAGCSISIAMAATDDEAIRRRLTEIAEDSSVPATQRMRILRAEPEIWQPPTAFAGRSPESVDYSAPLFHIRERYLWVYVEIAASPGGGLPSLSELNVRYPGRSLMENLPSIYRRNEHDRNDFIRGLVGVLETTTQSVDRRIAALGGLIHPATATKPWIDSIGRWLGLPWDDALTLEQKRALLQRAEELAAARGTRRGLETFLECLLPGTPRRFRVTDHTADSGFAIVDCARLPALLGGAARPIAFLDAAVLGRSWLACPGQTKDDAVSAWTGRIRVDIAATAEERAACEPWLAALLREMLPLTARLELRWVSAQALRGNRLGEQILESAPPARLDAEAITGLARLPSARTGLAASGTNIRNRLV